MRFFTFLQSYWQDVQHKDEEVMTFAGWIETIGYAKKNPHVGIPQIALYIKLQPHSSTVWTGFVKTCLAFQKEHPDSLPKHIQNKEDLQKFLDI